MMDTRTDQRGKEWNLIQATKSLPKTCDVELSHIFAVFKIGDTCQGKLVLGSL